ncbi:MAG: polyprenyl synthetase family protein [Sulfolobales archaeon]|nr:polyprenyl synthetase family protein [Sulfolobales archaeon]
MDLLSYWLEAKAEIDSLVSKFLESIREWEVLQVSKYILEGGKRFRGTLAMFFTEALGGNRRNAYDGALAVEILHSSSLALDDIVDYDLERRGRDSAWKVFGNRRVIYVSNFLVPSALQIIANAYGDGALKVSVELWKKTSIGALLDSFGKPTDYIKTVEYKTGSLFMVSTALSAFAAGKPELKDVMLELGKHLGTIYQVVDDYIDIVLYKAGKKGEPEGSAKQLKELAGEKVRDYVISVTEESTHAYLEAVKSLKIREEFVDGIITLPSFLMSGLLAEAGLDSL